MSLIAFVCSLAVLGISGAILANKIKNSTIVYASDEKVYEINDNNEVVEVFESNDKVNESDTSSVREEVEVKEENISKPVSDKLSLCLLGEIMMGGEVGENVSHSYASSFKKVYTKTRLSDFTYANFSTNITSLDKIDNPKSSYIVTKDILSALTALGIDTVSIASDHIIDFPSDIIKNTISLLEGNNIFVAGRKDTPVYFQKDDKRVAIVSTNSVINGTSTLYTNEGISIYESNNFIKNIKEAKDNADVVIVDIHWGREYVYGVTDSMRKMAMLAVDNGADLVIGSHAAGVYPIVTYKNVPIIYSLGYFIGDSDLYVGKESFIFDITVSKENKIEEIKMTPTYIKNKEEVLLYSEYDSVKCNEILSQYNNWQIENGLNCSVEDSVLKIKF